MESLPNRGVPPVRLPVPDPDEHYLAELRDASRRMLEAADRARAVVDEIKRERADAEPIWVLSHENLR